MIWKQLRSKPCFDQHSQALRAWFDLYAANAARDPVAMQQSAQRALKLSAGNMPRQQLEFAVTAALAGSLRASGPAAVLQLYGQINRDYQIDDQTPLALRLVLSAAMAPAR